MGYNGKFKYGNTPWNKGKRIELDLKQLEYLYFKKGKSTRDIAKELGVDQKTISNRLRQLGMKARGSKEAGNIAASKISKTMKERGIKPIRNNER